jgi:hypothetical protein
LVENLLNLIVCVFESTEAAPRPPSEEAFLLEARQLVAQQTTGDLGLHQLVDRSTVLCSSALSTLAEVSVCRRWLVNGGSLKMIKLLLESSIESIAAAAKLCFPEKDSSVDSDLFVRFFTQRFGAAYELLSNVSAALMYLSGGSDNRFQAGRGAGTREVDHQSQDYDDGWIDAKILAESIPELVVRLITSSTLSDLSSAIGAPSDITKSVLPGTVGVNLAKFFHQLCSRAQNRPHLAAVNVPLALGVLFESVCCRSYCLKRQRLADSPSDRILMHTFSFVGIFYKHLHAKVPQAAIETAAALQWESDSLLASLYATGIDEDNQPRVRLTNPADCGSDGVGSLARSSAPRGLGDWTPQSTSTSTSSRKNEDSSADLIMSSITISCIESLQFFVGDEVERASGSSERIGSPNLNTNPSYCALDGSEASQSGAAATGVVSPLKLMRFPKILQSLESCISTSFGNFRARIACISYP